MTKAQVAAKPFIFAVTAILAVLVLSFGFVYIRELEESAQKREVAIFIESVKSAIGVQSKQGYGSYVDRTMAVPKDITSICFVDRSKEFDDFANNELTMNIDNYPDSNFFVLPSEELRAEKLENFEIDRSPLCIKAVNGKVRLKLTSKLGTSTIDGFSEEDEREECVSVFYTSEPDDGIDIVFLGQAYKTTEEFKDEVYNYINNVFFKLEPFHANRDKFNFYMVDDFQDLSCTFNNYVLCNNFKVKRIASRCPHEFIFILIERNKIKDLVIPIRSSAIANIANINTADNPSVLMHEFGHSFGDLADEYVDDYYLQIKFDGEEYPNCDNSQCSKWAGTEGTDCLKGCSTDGYYRGTENSLMRSLYAEYYGPINEEAIIEKLSVYER
ncbi:M64 family metallopeptidase [Candidatus Woesearchaeota archaeon]|nr:M64 family metallopeptidase [Candidatus Woesearchaeota archaeon]